MVDKATQQQLNALKSQNQTQAQQIANLSRAIQSIQNQLQARVQAEQALGGRINQLTKDLEGRVEVMKGDVKR